MRCSYCSWSCHCHFDSCNRLVRPQRRRETPRTVADVPTVAVVQATRADLSSDLILTAEFEPFQEVDVMAKVSGYIQRDQSRYRRSRSRRTIACDARDPGNAG